METVVSQTKFLIPPKITAPDIKEYSDSNGLETPEIAGNSWEDFGFWAVGVGLAALACWVGTLVK